MSPDRGPSSEPHFTSPPVRFRNLTSLSLSLSPISLSCFLSKSISLILPRAFPSISSSLCHWSMRHTDSPQRERSRSPRRRSRSPRRSRRSYSPRSRSRSRDDYHRSDRRSRSPLSPGGTGGSAYGGRASYPPPSRSTEDRVVAKEHMMQNVRESSQQDRRVYVGNLSYDVKWHHLKDFMRQGEQGSLSLFLPSPQSLPSHHRFAEIV